MKTLSLHLIEGVIDEVDSTVQVRAAAVAGGALACWSRRPAMRIHVVPAKWQGAKLEYDGLV